MIVESGKNRKNAHMIAGEDPLCRPPLDAYNVSVCACLCVFAHGAMLIGRTSLEVSAAGQMALQQPLWPRADGTPDVIKR